MTPLEKELKKIVKATTKLSKAYSEEAINEALNSIGVRPFTDPPICKKGEIYNPLLGRCVPDLG